MIERYFIIRPEATICKDWEAYRENQKVLRKAICTFFTENGIEAEKFYAVGDALGIIPTEQDTAKFHDQFKKAVYDDGLRLFKQRSEIRKKWSVIAADIKPESKPAVWMYYNNLLGTLRTRLFTIDGVMYCSVESKYDFETPDDFTEIKASQFFKVIEDYEEQHKNES